MFEVLFKWLLRPILAAFAALFAIPAAATAPLIAVIGSALMAVVTFIWLVLDIVHMLTHWS